MSLAREPNRFFDHLLWSVHAEGRPVALLTYYADKSGSDDKSNVAVAGYVSDKRRWDNFGSQWQDILNDEGVEVLHRTDMEGPPFHGEFKKKGWTKEHQKTVLKRAHKVIRETRIIGHANSVKLKAYRQIIPPKVKDALGGAYGWCAHCCVVGIARWAEPRNHWITYIFEEGDEGRDEVEKAMRYLSRRPEERERYRIADWSFVPKKGPCAVIQVQSADFLAYEAYKQIDNRVIEGVRRKYRKSAKDLINRKKDSLRFWADKDLMDWIVRASEKPELSTWILSG